MAFQHEVVSRSETMVRSTLASGTTGPSDMSSNPFTKGLAGVNVNMDNIFSKTLWLSLGLLAVLILVTRVVQRTQAHIRHIFGLSATPEQQRFWSRNRSTVWPLIKRHLLFAPLWKKRHNREITLSAAVNVGTLPSRFHATLLSLYILSNVAYCCALDYNKESKAELLAELRGRSGVLALVNMIPLFIFAGRNNPLISLLHVSFDTYNLLHRWMGRMVVIESVVHTLAWGCNQTRAFGIHSIGEQIRTKPFVTSGAVGTIAMVLLVLHSPSAIRHAFYETFLHLHQVAALTAVVAVYFHLDLDKLPQLPYIQFVMIAWAIERIVRFLRIYYRCWTWKQGWTTVLVEALPGEACRLTFDMRRPWTFRPGCHVYAYLPSISLHQSHPFSVAWSEGSRAQPMLDDSEKLPMTKSDLGLQQDASPSISLVVHRRTGMTAKLYDRAAASPSRQIVLRGAVEGPYGGLESLHSYGTVILFAGGIGITHQVSYVRDLLQGYAEGTVATRKIVLVWTVRSTEHLEWVRPWMDSILQMPGRREVLKILLFVTKPRSPREVISPSTTVQMFPGRPQPEILLDKEIEDRVGAMAVTVCGPGSLADSVRYAARRRVDVAALDFIEESFTW
ncbi:MAG: hypothetical protein M1833_001093 [Piccolia ochrophora]|nr:MAG: hypothetical protein M1833_001093 [Piccolia ochrophora]